MTSQRDGRPARAVTAPSYRDAVAAAPAGDGCDECRTWAKLKIERKLPVSGDTACGKCGAREADVSRLVRAAAATSVPYEPQVNDRVCVTPGAGWASYGDVKDVAPGGPDDLRVRVAVDGEGMWIMRPSELVLVLVPGKDG